MHTEYYPRHRRNEASAYLKSRWGIERKPSTLAKYATVGGGPKFVHAGRFPLYPEPELDAWAKSLLSPLKSSTSDDGEEIGRSQQPPAPAATLPRWRRP